MRNVIFYVSPNGNDRWSGRRPRPDKRGTNGPFATLAQAQKAIRALKARSTNYGGIRVLIRRGTYELTAPLVLKPADSGTAESPIVYAAYPGETPVISGGRQITGWRRYDQRLWTVDLPAVKRGQWYFRQLFVNGERRCRARLPDADTYYPVASALNPQNIKDPRNKKGFCGRPGDLRLWRNAEDVEIVILHRWEISRSRLASVNMTKGVINLQTPAFWPILNDRRFFVDNVFEGLTGPGKWYLDRKAGRLYYWPMHGEDMRQAKVVAPCLSQLIRLEGRPELGRFVEHIHFKGLSFCHADWSLPKKGYPGFQAAFDVPGAIAAVGARHCQVKACEVAQVGTYAIEFGCGSQDNRIVGNHLHDLGAGAIKIGENIERWDEAAAAGRNAVTDNRIYDGGKVYLGAVGIWLGHGHDNRIAHNEIHNLYYTGISVGWDWNHAATRTVGNIIEFNHIHHVLMNRTLSDGGGIYTLGISPGTVIRNNLIHDIYGHTAASRGIYLDAATYGIVVENNIVHHTLGPGFRAQVFTTGNVIVNNIFALGSAAQLGFDTDRPNVFMRNIVYWEEGKLFTRDQWDSYDTMFDNNLYWRSGGGPIRFGSYSFKAWRQKSWVIMPNRETTMGFDPSLRLDQHSRIADPLFVNLKKGNFALKPTSPAWALGFQPIDISTVGPRSPRYWDRAGACRENE